MTPHRIFVRGVEQIKYNPGSFLILLVSGVLPTSEGCAGEMLQLAIRFRWVWLETPVL